MAKNGKRYSRYNLIDTKTSQVVDKSEPNNTDKFLRYRRVKSNVKGEIKDGIGVLGILFLLALVYVVARTLSGVSTGEFSFAYFLEELISFDGIDIFKWANWKIDFDNNLGNLGALEEILNFLLGLQGPFAEFFKFIRLILFSLINAAMFIIHALGILFGV